MAAAWRSYARVGRKSSQHGCPWERVVPAHSITDGMARAVKALAAGQTLEVWPCLRGREIFIGEATNLSTLPAPPNFVVGNRGKIGSGSSSPRTPSLLEVGVAPNQKAKRMRGKSRCSNPATDEPKVPPPMRSCNKRMGGVSFFYPPEFITPDGCVKPRPEPIPRGCLVKLLV